MPKRYSSLRKDLGSLIVSVRANPKLGTPLSGGVYNIRFAIKSNGKGKRGGGRIISLYFERDSELFLLSIYDKSDQETISDARISALVEEAMAPKLRGQ